ncbi:hypothetical protein M2165_000220 [Variovorax sp. TBS-050B]|uniref:2'-5' RNA ligase family protein n=1 Tax=Variovorax sp. TBS-050B TaxID=2940551 RepID=UPI0024730D8C|nr:2'-5' RNA ligase family protein [Variovorax sp. TBS-050B]MDH6590331.1 hypothetical protein [Variovorax sp. TBS-050B]
MAISAFIVDVPAAEPRVADLRARFDATAALGVPAHVTVLVPFMDPDKITPAVLAEAQRALDTICAFDFSLDRVGRFPETAYLAPEPAAPFVEMTMALWRRFPEFPPYGGEHAGVIAHLTAAHGSAANAEAAAALLEERLRAQGPVQARCASVTLIENSSGVWKRMQVFPLRDAGR